MFYRERVKVVKASSVRGKNGECEEDEKNTPLVLPNQ